MVEIEFKFPEWGGRVASQEQRIRLFQAATIQTNRAMLFDSEGSHNGHDKWPGLQLRQGQILSDRGTLRKSIAPSNPDGSPGQGGYVSFSGDAITIGTTLIYARLMNEGTAKMPGGVLRPVKAKALRIPLPAGKNATDKAKSLRAGGTLQSARNQEAAIKKAEQALQDKSASVSNASAKTRQKKQIAFAKANASLQDRRLKLQQTYAKAAKIKKTGIGGDKFIFRKWVRIPARNFTSWNELDQQEMNAATLTLVARIMNERTV